MSTAPSPLSPPGASPSFGNSFSMDDAAVQNPSSNGYCQPDVDMQSAPPPSNTPPPPVGMPGSRMMMMPGLPLPPPGAPPGPGMHMPSMPPMGHMGTPPPAQSELPPLHPNKTLYVNNLDSKIKTDKLKRDLRAIFENSGDVKEVIAMKSFWRRGQAWIVFSNQESADKALAELNGFPYNKKPMRIQYAREISDIFAKEEGTFVERPPGPKKPRAIVEREQRLQSQLQQFQQMMQQHMTQLQQSGQMMPSAGQQLGQAMRQMGQQQMGQQQMEQQQMGQQQQQMGQQQMGQQQMGQQQMGQQMGQMGQPMRQMAQSGSLMGQPVGAPGMGMAAVSPSLVGQIPSTQPPPPTTQMPQQFAEDNRPTASKESMVAAAAAAAAQAVEAAAKKRAADAASPITKMPRTGDVGGGAGFSRGGFSSGPPPTAPPPIGIPTTGFYGGPSMASSGGSAAPSVPAHPSPSLFVENLPEDCDASMLRAVFQQYPGCQDIRHIASRKVAFVDYETIPHASVALRCLNNFSMKEGHTIRVSYAK